MKLCKNISYITSREHMFDFLDHDKIRLASEFGVFNFENLVYESVQSSFSI